MSILWLDMAYATYARDGGHIKKLIVMGSGKGIKEEEKSVMQA